MFRCLLLNHSTHFLSLLEWLHTTREGDPYKTTTYCSMRCLCVCDLSCHSKRFFFYIPSTGLYWTGRHSIKCLIRLIILHQMEKIIAFRKKSVKTVGRRLDIEFYSMESFDYIRITWSSEHGLSGQHILQIWNTSQCAIWCWNYLGNCLR